MLDGLAGRHPRFKPPLFYVSRGTIHRDTHAIQRTTVLRRPVELLTQSEKEGEGRRPKISRTLSARIEGRHMDVSWEVDGVERTKHIKSAQTHGFALHHLEGAIHDPIVIAVQRAYNAGLLRKLTTHEVVHLGPLCERMPIVSVQLGSESFYFTLDGVERKPVSMTSQEGMIQRRLQRDLEQVQQIRGTFDERAQIAAVKRRLLLMFQSGGAAHQKGFREGGIGFVIGSSEVGGERDTGGSAVVGMTNVDGRYPFANVLYPFGRQFAEQPLIVEIKGPHMIARRMTGELVRVLESGDEMGFPFGKIDPSDWQGLQCVYMREFNPTDRKQRLVFGLTEYNIGNTRMIDAARRYGIPEGEVARQAVLVVSDPRRRDGEGHIRLEITAVFMDKKGRVYPNPDSPETEAVAVDSALRGSNTRERLERMFPPELRGAQRVSESLVRMWPLNVVRLVLRDYVDGTLGMAGELRQNLPRAEDVGLFVEQSIAGAVRGLVHHMAIANNFDRERRVISELEEVSRRVHILHDLTKRPEERTYLFSQRQNPNEFLVYEPLDGLSVAAPGTRWGAESIPRGRIRFYRNAVELQTWSLPTVVEIAKRALKASGMKTEARTMRFKLPEGMLESKMTDVLKSDEHLVTALRRGWELAGEASLEERERAAKSGLSVSLNEQGTLSCMVSTRDAGDIAREEMVGWLRSGSWVHDPAPLIVGSVEGYGELVRGDGVRRGEGGIIFIINPAAGVSADAFEEWMDALKKRTEQRPKI